MTGFLSDLNGNLQRLAKYQSQMQSGRKIQNLSDDPVGVVSGLRARERLYHLAQYQRNIGDAKRWLETSETAATEMNKAVTNAYEALIDADTNVKTPEDREKIALVVKAQLEHILSLGNSTTIDKYSFGGFNTTSTPFTKDPADPTGESWLYNGKPLNSMTQADIDAEKSRALKFEVGYAMDINVSVTGPELMIYDSSGPPNKNIINTLQGLYDALTDPTISMQDLQPYITDLQSAQDHLSSVVADFGGRWNRMEMMEDRYSKEELLYTEVMSNFEDADASEAIMNFAMAEMVYNASLQAGAKVIQPTLLDYLR